MKILLVVCLLATASAAPAGKSKRNILPGDSRYDPKGHHHHEEHEHHENEIETSQALQNDFGGSVPVPDSTYGVFGSTTGTPLGLSDYFKYDFGADLSGFSPETVNIGGVKLIDQSNSVTESSVTSPKVVSVSLVESSGFPEATTPVSIESVSIQNNGDKQASKAAEETKVETKSASDDTSSDISKTSEKPAVQIKSSAGSLIPNAASFSSVSQSTPFQSNFDFGSTFDSSFGSSIGQPSFGSGFESFDQSSFNPSFQSGINANYEFFGNGGVNYPVDFGTYSGFEQSAQRPVIDSQVSASFSQYNPLEFNKNIGYLPPFQSGYSAAPETVTASPFPSLFSVTQAPETVTASPFPSLFSVTQAPETVTASPFPSLLSVSQAPTNFNFGSQQEYLSPIQEQQQIFNNYKPAPAKQSTSVTIEKSIEPEIKISEGSSSGITQLTDANGGYIY